MSPAAGASQTIRFPKPMKRGAKVRTGPVAVVLQFPSQLTGDALRARWAWLLDNHPSWNVDATDGTYQDPADWEASARSLGPAYASLRGMQFGDASMQRDVAEWGKIIETRHQVKSWIRSQGVDPRAFRSADTALAFVYGRVLSADPLFCA